MASLAQKPPVRLSPESRKRPRLNWEESIQIHLGLENRRTGAFHPYAPTVFDKVATAGTRAKGAARDWSLLRQRSHHPNFDRYPDHAQNAIVPRRQAIEPCP